MSKKKTPILSYARKSVATSFAAIIFLLPIYVSGTWIAGVAKGTDPRETRDYTNTFVVRPADVSTRTLSPFEEPLLSVTFDDGWESPYSAGLPIMQKYGIISTQYILAGEFNNTGNLSVPQVKSFQKYGHEIAAHSFDHPDLTTLNDTELNKQVVQSKQILEKKFGTVKDFAPPHGARNAKTTDLISKNFRSQRNTDADPINIGDEDINLATTFNRYDIMAFTVRNTTTLADIERLVDYAAARKAWAVITYHQIDDSGAEFAVNKEMFSAQMQLLYKKPIRVKPIGQVLDAIEARKAN